MGTLRERAEQLKERRPGYGALLDFYVSVRESQITIKGLCTGESREGKKEREGPPGRRKVFHWSGKRIFTSIWKRRSIFFVPCAGWEEWQIRISHHRWKRSTRLSMTAQWI